MSTGFVSSVTSLGLRFGHGLVAQLYMTFHASPVRLAKGCATHCPVQSLPGASGIHTAAL